MVAVAGAAQRSVFFLQLTDPAPLRSPMSLKSPRAPVLSLLDELHMNGWSGREEIVMHVQASYKAYDERMIASKRSYLKCLLTLSELLSLIGEFPSGEPPAFYELLLRGKVVKAGKSAKEYRTELAALDGDLVESAVIAAEGSSTIVPPSLMDRPPPAIADDGCSIYAGSDGGLDGDAPPAPAPPLADAPGDGGMEDAAEVFVEDAPPGQPLVGLPADIPWPARVLGQKLNTIKGRRGGGWSYEPRLSIACNNPADEGCSKSRSVASGCVLPRGLAAMISVDRAGLNIHQW